MADISDEVLTTSSWVISEVRSQRGRWMGRNVITGLGKTGGNDSPLHSTALVVCVCVCVHVCVCVVGVGV